MDGAPPTTLHAGTAAIALLAHTTVHARAAAEHVFVEVGPGTHWVNASFDPACANATALETKTEQVCRAHVL